MSMWRPDQGPAWEGPLDPFGLGCDPQTEPDTAMDEVEWVTMLIVAAAETDERLSPAKIDEILGVSR